MSKRPERMQFTPAQIDWYRNHPEAQRAAIAHGVLELEAMGQPTELEQAIAEFGIIAIEEMRPGDGANLRTKAGQAKADRLDRYRPVYVRLFVDQNMRLPPKPPRRI